MTPALPTIKPCKASIRSHSSSRHVANSMAMEGELVDEVWIRERLARFILGHSQPLVKATHAWRIPQRLRSVSAKAEKSLRQA